MNQTPASNETPLAIFSSDTHIGPRYEDLEPYCPQKYLDDYREWARTVKNAFMGSQHAGGVRRFELNALTEGHHDITARLHDMDDDGVSAGVIFHGSQNGLQFPFGSHGGTGFDLRTSIDNFELEEVGHQMYNRWLADVCATDPDRHLGVAHIPAWDPAKMAHEMTKARESGLRAVNLPAPRPYIKEYNDEAWEPVWAASSDLDMPLMNHSGALVPGIASGDTLPNMDSMYPIIYLELVGQPTRRGLARMIFSGAFERHPNLKLVMVEQPGTWWASTMRDMDAIWRRSGDGVRRMTPRMPSEYAKDSVFVGASFIAHYEAESAVRGEYSGNYMWGSDYPHREGTWAYKETEDEPSRSRLALHSAFTGLPEDAIREMTEGVAARVFGMDLDRLRETARRINAPSPADLAAPLSDHDKLWVERFRDFDNDYTDAFRIDEEVGVNS